MNESITDILSGKGADAPEPERVVDEPEAIVGSDLAVPSQATLPEDRPEPPKKPDVQQEEPKTVPLAALQDERGKVKRYTEEVAEFRRAQADQAAQIARLNALLEQRQQQQQEKPDWYADPDAAISQRLGAELTPIQAQLQKMQTDFMRTNAIVVHGAEKVSAFEQYVNEAMARNDPEMQILSAQMRASADPMATGLKWFEHRTFDPAAKEAEIEAKILAKYGLEPNGGQQQQIAQRPQQLAPVMPSTSITDGRSAAPRTGSGWSGPPSIGDVLAANKQPKTIFR